MRSAWAGPSALTVHLMGGLGNQLFQYAFGRQLSLANNAELWLDATGYGQPGRRDAKTGVRECELWDYNIKARIMTSRDYKEGRGELWRKSRKLVEIGLRIVDKCRPYYARHEIIEPPRSSFRFDPAIANRKFSGTLSIRGFWQSERYFREIGDVLRTELSLRVEPPTSAQKLAARMGTTTSVAIHVRHGDNATTVAAALGVLPRRYYETAMRAIAAEVTEPRYFIFSDDISWAADLLGFGQHLTYVSGSHGGRSSTDLYLMACCRHHIVANSTFSWWGAWLGKKEGQIVYAPERYFLNIDVPNADFYPSGWRLIKT